MIRLLPYILIPVLILGALGYWRYSATKQNLATSQADSKASETASPMEVPKTLPALSSDDKVKNLEDSLTKLTAQVNSLKSAAPQSSGSVNSRLDTMEAAVAELKVRVSALEKSAPAPAASSSKYPAYIPLGSSGNSWNNQDWVAISDYKVSVNPDDYPGYSGMQLEVNFRLNEPSGTASVRLYNQTDASSVSSSQVDTTSTTFDLQSSGIFKLSSGQKTYTLQVKSSGVKDVFIQSARIKVSF